MMLAPDIVGKKEDEDRKRRERVQFTIKMYWCENMVWFVK